MDPDSKMGRWSGKYAIVKLIAKIAFYFFYRRIYLSGQTNIPQEGPLIFAANHQNALMDALAVLMTSKFQLVFLARADLFRRPLIARIMKFFKIMPVYRFKDGVDSMGQNEDTFEKTSKILAAGGCIGIMPEGNQDDKKRLRVLKKGVFRIALRAEKSYDNKLGIKIIPVGLDYSNTHGIFGELAVNYGEPIIVSEYFDLYSKHSQKAINKMKQDLAGSLKSLMIDIKDESHYKQDKLLLDIGSKVMLEKRLPGYDNSINKFTVSRVLCRAIYDYFENNPDKAGELRSKSTMLAGVLETYNIPLDSIDNKPNPLSFFSILKRIICFPMFLAGFLFHILPLLIIHMALKKLKDSQFLSSYKFALGLLLIPLNYFVLAVLFFTYFSTALAAIIIVMILPLGFAAHYCYRDSRKQRDVFRFRWLCRENKSVAMVIADLNSKIIEGLEPVCSMAESRLK